MPTTVFRFETFEGFGVYVANTPLTLDQGSDRIRHPDPKINPEDGIDVYQMKSYHYFGFKDEQQATDWFDLHDDDLWNKLTQNNILVVMYSVELCDVIFGKRQLVFARQFAGKIVHFTAAEFRSKMLSLTSTQD